MDTRSGTDSPIDPLASQLAEQFGLREATKIVTQLRQLSTRLWETPRSADGHESFDRIADRPELDAIVALVTQHARRVRRVSFDELAAQRRNDVDQRSRAEAAAVLVTGMLALGATDWGRKDAERLLSSLVHIAFGEDDLSILARRALLGGIGDDWPPPIPGGNGLPPPLGGDCIFEVQQAAGRLGGMIAGGRNAGTTLPTSDANGITGLSPNRGSSGDTVTILGDFPTFPPRDQSVMFQKAGGGILAATVLSWVPAVGSRKVTEIVVLAPDPVGDGPVGFVTYPGVSATSALDPTAAMEFASALGNCLGPAAGGVAGRVNYVPPIGIALAAPPIPTLAGDVNVFHGGPVLVSVSVAFGAEPDPAITVIGLNLQQGDTVILENTPAPTTFVSATRLTFRVPAMTAGHTYLTIQRGIHRSNGTAFDVRASLTKPGPAGRVMPGSWASLKGTGFGPEITATLDGGAVTRSVNDTHNVDVLIHRPARTPIPAEKRGEPVTVELFDRGRSLGTIKILVGTIRIASFGDSIVWGQGLLETDKFTTLAATAVSLRRNGSIAVFSVDRSAHSGARILPASDTPDGMQPRPPGDFTGECPGGTPTSGSPSIAAQVKQWTSHTLADRNEIDLVILDGGINDVGIGEILNPFLDDTPLASDTIAMCGPAMVTLLGSVLTTFPMAAVIVTGYYQIVSEQSDLSFLIPALSGAGLLAGLVTPLVPGAVPIGLDPISAAVFSAWLQARLTIRSALFATLANAMLQTSVTNAVAAAPGRRVTLAVPAFGPRNAIFAPDAFLWGVGLSTGGLVPLDPIAAIRIGTCGTSLISTIASIGHPNVKGAMAYGTAIEAALPRVGF